MSYRNAAAQQSRTVGATRELIGNCGSTWDLFGLYLGVVAGICWNRLQLAGSGWVWLRLAGSGWGYLELLGMAWGCLELLGIAGDRLEFFGIAQSCLGGFLEMLGNW